MLVFLATIFIQIAPSLASDNKHCTMVINSDQSDFSIIANSYEVDKSLSSPLLCGCYGIQGTIYMVSLYYQ